MLFNLFPLILKTRVMSEISSTKVVTGLVRFSYAHVFEPKAIQQNQDPKYSVSLIIPKSDKDTVAKIKAAIEAAKVEGTAKFGGKIPPTLKLPLRDGDEERPDDEAYRNAYFVNANAGANNRPQVVDRDLNPILDKEEFYSGCYGRASINFYAFNTNGNKGVACGLNNVQKLKDGDKLGSGSTAAEDFGGLEYDDDDDLM